MTNRWIRLHRNALHNPKIVLLNDRQYRAWSSCLLIADDSGKLPGMRDVACHLRMTIPEAEQILCDLIEAVLIDVDRPGTSQRSFRMHDWDAHQYISDSSAERTRKYREKKKKPKGNSGDGAVTSQAASQTVAVTPPEPEPETETETENFASSQRSKAFEGLRKKHAAVSGRLRRLAEGFGLPVDELCLEATKPNVEKPNGMFRFLAVKQLQKQLPLADKRVLEAAFGTRGDAAKGTVFAMLMDADALRPEYGARA